MPRRRPYKRRSKSVSNLSGSLAILGLLIAAYIYMAISDQQMRYLVVGAIAFAVIFLAGIALFGWRRGRKAFQKLRALQMVDVDRMDGLVFEKFVAELLKSQGYSRVTLTEKYDLGIDIIAYKNKIAWGIQVKRHSHMVKAEAVRQVVTGLKQYRCDRAMVVTNNVFSRPARLLAESNACVLVGKDELAEWIVEFQLGAG